jgi:uncharacterized protein (TIGR00304 family)
MATAEIIFQAGFALILAGIAIVVLVFLLSFRSAGKGKVKAGGAVIIGPVPIVFGTDRKSLKTVLLLSVILTVLVFVAFVVQVLVMR